MTEKLKGRKAVLFDLLFTRRKARADYLAAHPMADYSEAGEYGLPSPEQLARDIHGLSDEMVEHLISYHTGGSDGAGVFLVDLAP